ncbi:beta-ketoacyl-ACP synthase III [Rhodococcus kroppenstedtii]|uniref:Beta-ketoacyl-[acyl-carrier-protein] synthase III n=1 Tax=Rhodococcoides kroppenstedtii TaxID=293050 RepID=A0ABS7NNT3_9NOCA|nr:MULTISPECIES: beta-ketoacyl-ACP synthase III [Rhodococcus]AMY19646.1 3-oxoacyl-[acyl-carrier-protein] synthase 3 [Rhodococcus sp. PBTS 1]MBY6312237.1 ketoacyl-ACP synthase III [Rhodococcus kroppenstedtii]MBY6319679.1 ketoacyl-ACP synthase III [Rhodococcus kroppenstedtii]MBY6398362.1 ketoacyl-ACP synthase III [Rhodococcus kroppenstedtii]MBY6436055.1 ketoacyl-ACP synthase III [Rhodococcus kroppenstedtii]
MGAQITVPSETRHSGILGIGAFRPERVVTNEEICRTIDSSDEWIRTRTGIESRRFAAENENVVYMSIEAGRRALENSGVDPSEIGCIIVATSTHLLLSPPAAPIVADALGLDGPGAFDLGAGCAGFCYGLATASDMVRSGTANKVLVIGVEQLSVTTRPDDRGTRMIFGDGAGAMVIGLTDEPAIGPVVWGSDGSQWEAIRQDKDWLQYFADLKEDPTADRPWIAMTGIAVFRWAAFEMAKVAREALDKAGITAGDLDVFVPHQANSRITDLLAKSLELAEDIPVANDIAEAGNTSAASIPLAVEELLRTGKAKKGDTALLLGFGAGLSFAGQVVTLPDAPAT